MRTSMTYKGMNEIPTRTLVTYERMNEIRTHIFVAYEGINDNCSDNFELRADKEVIVTAWGHLIMVH